MALYMRTEEEIPRVQCNITTIVAEPFLCRQLLASQCFAESNTVFNCQTRDTSLTEKFDSWDDDLPTPRSLDNQVSICGVCVLRLIKSHLSSSMTEKRFMP